MADKDIATEMQDPEVPHEEEEESVHDEPLEENPAQEVEVLHEHQIQIHTADLEVKERYEDVRKYSVPDVDTRRRVDTCDAVSKQLIERLHVLQDEDTDKHLPTVRAPWGNTGSVFSCQEDQVSMLSPPFSGRVSKRSSVSSTKKQEAEAELAATKATLKVLAEMEQEEKELERLEAENRRQLAQQEAENAERHKLLEEKRRQLKRLEATKRMNAAKARLQVYEQDVGSDEEISDLLHNHNLPPLKANALPRYSMPSQSASKLPTTTYEVPKPTSQVARPTFHDNSTTMLAEAIAESINTSRLPVPEPPIFSGDPIRYKDWKMSFLTLIGRKNIPVNEKIYYLRKYVTGAAKKAIESYFLVGTEEAYYSTWEILEERYGNSFVVAKAFRDKLNSWTKIGPKDSVELREFADFLRGCQAAMSHIKSLEVLNDCSENQRILSKLPDWLTARWNRKVMEFEEEPQDFPSFHTFVEFVSREAKIACNPMTSLHALKSGDAERAKPSKVRNVGAKVLASASEEKPDVEGQRGNAKGCMFCEKTNHGIQTCRKLIEKPIKERVKYVQTKKLCFACLRPGHHSKSCEKRSVCNVCTGRHPTCLHEDRAKADEKIQADGQNESGKPSKGKEKPKEQKHGDTESTTTEVTSTAMSNQVMHNRNSTYASTIVPVWLSTTRNPDAEVLVYALLDSQSDSTFILQERAETLDTQMEPVQLKLSTLASKRTLIPSHKLVGLQVRGFYSSKKIPLPVTYSRDFIPASLSHIPTPKTARAWSHLEHLAEEIAPLIDCDVGLLIGYNCSQALLPREIVSGKDDEPFAVRTDLGWSIVGRVNPCVDYGDAIGSSHRIIVKQVTPSLQSSSDLTNQVQYICRTQVKEVIVPNDVLKVLESDFSERNVEDAHFSQDDLHFITKMEKGIKTQANGQREMPLPFKEDKPCLPNNLKCADHRLRCLKRRFEKDKQYQKDYVAFMSDIISCGDAEKFRVTAEHQDYLRFLWWDNGDIESERPLSRRGVLSTVASIFDPLGFVAPFILIGKQILQRMCRDKVGWDDPLPDDLRPRWESWLLDLKNLADVKIQRCYLPSEFKQVQRYELHYFSDASVLGYGECTYLRVISKTGQIHCSLVMGKARVAPTKVTTVPRLELSAAVVAVRMSDMLRKELEIDAQEVFWTDSKVVLGYVYNDARRFHVFVANRIQRIKDSTRPDQWRHVSSEDNPADHASRGLRAQELIASNWFSGPDFLWCEELPSGNVEVEDVAVEDPEVRNVFVHKASATEVLLLDRFLKFSCWTRLVKAIARLMRLTEELKGSIPRTNEATSLVERSDAEATIISLVQREAFAEEIQTLQHRKELVKTSKLHKLNPFLDEQGILRVGGRLTHADLHHHIKHPAVLPAKGHVTRLLIQHYHQQVQHQGRGITVNELRANGFWILGCSHAVSSCINKCVKCRRFRRSTENQLMADLPRDRMEETPPFTCSGIDCFGPFYVKDGRKESKRYGLLFTCLCSRAVHIELLEEMTTDFFIIALRAFIAIRGNVRQLRCDQGTNFVGARREFIEALKEMDQERLKILGCEFFMNPPSASHMGGAWERQIRIIRSVLTSILDQSSNRLDTSSLRTYFYEVMAVINSRPLTAHLLNDPMGPQPLSPNHILTMKSSIILPPPGKFEREDLYLRKRWRKVQHLANEFWSRWRKEYLLNLQPRQKWQRKRRNAKVNDIVIVQDDTAPRTEWKLAKVTKVYPAEDGCVSERVNSALTLL
ncbi:hypothetical protein SRHO_G00059060 [Serrasalmus rhombeus]